MYKRLLVILSLFFSVTLLSAQGTRLLRQPTISSKHIVFVYADDLWLVDRDGGDAKRLTSHEGTESFPHFSPDGSMVAFSAQYDGNTDVFVVNTEGGEPRRLTYHPDAEVVQGWTPDGKQILFRSGRAGAPTMINHFYTIGFDGGNETKLPIPQASFGEISEDGNFVAYTPITSWDPEWRNYRGGQALPIGTKATSIFCLKEIMQTTYGNLIRLQKNSNRFPSTKTLIAKVLTLVQTESSMSKRDFCTSMTPQ
jgi:tricorn protease